MHASLDQRVVEIDVPVDLAAVDGIRARLVDAAEAWGFSEVEPLALVASEIVTNAMVHAGTPARLTCRRLGSDEVELAVTDHGGGSPHVPAQHEGAPSGRGLLIVDALSAAWGVDHPAAGDTTVWARLAGRAPA